MINLFANFVLGLKKFLLQYPALFNVDGNNVTINCHQNTASDEAAAGKKDYIQEAKDYFSQKMIQYGPGTDVPIKSLLGHRSQASPQVRHISGQHIKEFTDFLSRHPDTFRVTDEHVMLINFDAAAFTAQSETLHLPQPSIDIKFTQEVLDFLANCIEGQGPILVDQLFHYVMSNFPQDQWFRIFKTSNDLLTFLKLFSDCFNVQSNLVTLLQKPKISENHIHNAEKVFSKNIINSSSSTSPVVGDFKLNGPVSVSNGMLVNNNSTATKSIKSGNYNDDSLLSNGRNPSSLNEIRLDNLCAGNIPEKITYTHEANHNDNNESSTTTKQQQPLQTPRERSDRRINMTFKQSIDSLVRRTLAENEEKDRKAPVVIAPSNGSSVESSNSSSTVTSPIHNQNNYFQGEKWKIKVLSNTQKIETVKQSLFVVEAIRKSAKSPNERVVISFDCEVVNAGTESILTLMQIGTMRGEAFIFDLKVCPQMATEGGLKMLLEDENVIKIIHDCRNDSFNLHSQYNILLRNVFDTQVELISYSHDDVFVASTN